MLEVQYLIIIMKIIPLSLAIQNEHHQELCQSSKSLLVATRLGEKRLKTALKKTWRRNHHLSVVVLCVCVRACEKK